MRDTTTTMARRPLGRTTRQPLLALVASLSVGIFAVVSPDANAGNVSRALTITGVITSTPPAAVCTIVSAPTFSFNVQASAAQYSSNVDSAVLTCTAGLPFQVSSETQWKTFDIGTLGGRIGLALVNPSSADANIATSPITAVGTASEQRIALRVKLGGQAPGSNLNPQTDYGAFTGTINLLLLY